MNNGIKILEILLKKINNKTAVTAKAKRVKNPNSSFTLVDRVCLTKGKPL
jgi:hypothetical protein